MIIIGFIFAGIMLGLVIAYSTIKSEIMNSTYAYPTPTEVNKTVIRMQLLYVTLFLLALADIIWSM